MSLDGFALEGGFFGVGEGVFGFGGGEGFSGEGLGAGFDFGGFFAGGLEFLGFSAEAAYFDGAWFGDEVAHEEIFSRVGFPVRGRRAQYSGGRTLSANAGPPLREG